MLRTPVAEALGAASAASEIRIGGWVRTRRDAKGFSFLELNDGSCLGNIQCIVDEGTAAWDKLEGVNTGACVAVTGELVESPGKGQKWEVRAKDMTVFGLADPETFRSEEAPIPTNSCVPLRTCVPVPTSTGRPSASVPKPRTPCTTFSIRTGFIMCIRPS